MIPQDLIDKKTLMVLVNCIYFGGKWNDPFYKEMNYEGNFTAEDGSIKTMEFMYQNSDLHYGSSVDELKGASAVSMTYENTSVSMLFVLPPKDADFRTWMSSIQTINWTAVDLSLRLTNIKFSIPKFNITFDKDIKKFLQNVKIFIKCALLLL
jgi:serine protease inhibitor